MSILERAEAGLRAADSALMALRHRVMSARHEAMLRRGGELAARSIDSNEFCKIDTSQDIKDLMALLIEPAQPLKLLVQAPNASWGFGFEHAPDSHPWVAFLRGAVPSLRSFYEKFQPKSLAQGFLDDERWQFAEPYKFPEPVPFEIQSRTPWLGSRGHPFQGEVINGRSFKSSDGIQHYGPVSAQKVAAEETALKQLASSLASFGYVPSMGGLISGHFIISGESWRFIVNDGQHRAAALTALGHKYLPCTIGPGSPVLFDVTSFIGNWAVVADYYFRPDLAIRRKVLVRSLR